MYTTWRSIYLHNHPLTPPKNTHTDYHQEMDMLGWDITNESTKANPAPAATNDSWNVCIINTIIRLQTVQCMWIYHTRNSWVMHKFSSIQWLLEIARSFRRKEILQSVEPTVAVAYVGPEPSMKIRPSSEAWTIACNIRRRKAVKFWI